MTFYVENETEESFDFDINDLIEKCTYKVLSEENVPYTDISLNVTFTDDESIHAVNKEFRNIDKATDVLSFPTIDFEKPADFTNISSDDCDYFDPDTNELILGDIMISLDHAKAQANEYGHSYRREIAFLIMHSLLHLLGYDHMDDDERLEMEKKQTEYLNSLNITRESD